MGCGGTVNYLVDTVLNYPTLSEAYKVAALDATNKIRAVHMFTSGAVDEPPVPDEPPGGAPPAS
jgi:NAD(P) transhydrogenase